MPLDFAHPIFLEETNTDRDFSACTEFQNDVVALAQLADRTDS